jgi:hypothetical protein
LPSVLPALETTGLSGSDAVAIEKRFGTDLASAQQAQREPAPSAAQADDLPDRPLPIQRARSPRNRVAVPQPGLRADHEHGAPDRGEPGARGTLHSAAVRGLRPPDTGDAEERPDAVHPRRRAIRSRSRSRWSFLDGQGLTVRTTGRNVGDAELPFGAGFPSYLTVGTPRIDETILHAYPMLFAGDTLAEPESRTRSLAVEPMPWRPTRFAAATACGRSRPTSRSAALGASVLPEARGRDPLGSRSSRTAANDFGRRDDHAGGCRK